MKVCVTSQPLSIKAHAYRSVIYMDLNPAALYVMGSCTLLCLGLQCQLHTPKVEKSMFKSLFMPLCIDCIFMLYACKCLCLMKYSDPIGFCHCSRPTNISIKMKISTICRCLHLPLNELLMQRLCTLKMTLSHSESEVIVRMCCIKDSFRGRCKHHQCVIHGGAAGHTFLIFRC